MKTTKCAVEVAATTKRKMWLQLRPGTRTKRSTLEGRREGITYGTLMILLAWRMSSMRIILLAISIEMPTEHRLWQTVGQFSPKFLTKSTSKKLFNSNFTINSIPFKSTMKHRAWLLIRIKCKNIANIGTNDAILSPYHAFHHKTVIRTTIITTCQTLVNTHNQFRSILSLLTIRKNFNRQMSQMW